MKIPSHKLASPLLVLTGVLSLLGQFARSQTPFGYVSWYEISMLLLILCAAPLLQGVSIKKHWKKLTPIFLFFTWTQITTVLHPEVTITGTAYLARFSLYIAFGLSLKLLLDKAVLTYTHLRLGVLLWLASFALLGILQFLFLPDTRMFFYIGWDEHLSRAFATLFDPGYFGLLMVTGVLCTLWEARLQKNWWHHFLLALFLIATALSYSRASYLALCVGVIVLAYFTHLKKMLLVLPLFIMSLVLLPKDGGGAGQNLLRTQTLAMREEVIQIHTKSLRLQDQIIGRGWYYEKALALHEHALGGKQTEIERQNSAGVDNAFLHVFLSTGIVGSVIFLAMLLTLFLNSESVFWKSVLAAVSAHSFFSLGLLYPWILLLLAVTFFLREEPSANKEAAYTNKKEESKIKKPRMSSHQ